MTDLRDEERPLTDDVTRTTVFTGRVWDVVTESFRYGDATLTRDFVAHPGAAAVVALAALEARVGEAGVLNGLAGLAYRKRRFQEAQPMFIEALGLMEQALSGSDARLLPLLDNLAALHRSLGRPGESEYARRAAVLRRELGQEG